MEMLTAAKAAAFAGEKQGISWKDRAYCASGAAGTVPPHHHEHDGTVICF